MSDKVELNTFPARKTEALAMLYLQKQDLAGISPSELVDKYEEVLDEIKERFRENASAKSFNR
jgi:hypothetical protein